MWHSFNRASHEKRSWFAVWIFLSRACASWSSIMLHNGKGMHMRQRVSRGTYRCQQCSVWIFLQRMCVCKLTSEYANSAHICDLHFLFGSFRLALKPPVQVRMFPNGIKQRVSECMLRGAGLQVHVYYVSRSGTIIQAHTLTFPPCPLRLLQMHAGTARHLLGVS